VSAQCSVERQGRRNNKDEVGDDDQCIKSTAQIFPQQMSYTQSTKSKIGNGHATYFQKVRGLIVADSGVDKVLSDICCGNIGWLAVKNNLEVDGGLLVLLFADSVRYVPARTQKFLAGRMGNTPYSHQTHTLASILKIFADREPT